LRYSTAARLTLGFAFVIVLLLAAVWIAVSRLSALNGLVERLVKDDWAKAELTREIVVRMDDNARASFELLHATERAPLLARIEGNRQDIDMRLDILEARQPSVEARALFDAARQQRAAFVHAFKTTAGLLEAGQRDEAARVMRRATLPQLQLAVAAFDRLQRHHNVEMERTATAAGDAYRRDIALLLAFILVAWLTASLGAWWIIRSVTRPLGGEPTEATAIARRIAAGDLSGVIHVRPGDSDSLMAAMKTMQDNMRRLLALVKADSEEIEALNEDLEVRVRQRTAELEVANSELQNFSHAMAHDLQTPLRAQEGFSRLLLDEFAGKMDAGAVDCVRRINGASRRMSQMIDDLQELMSIARTQPTVSEIDLSLLGQQEIAQLRLADPQRQVEVLIAPGLRILADVRMMRLVVGNLLGNAWKFTQPREVGRIELGAATRDGEMACFVRDNGIGFDPAYAGKLFQPFRRLVNLHQFEGAGVGLALVKRIVERHGGRVWAESRPEQGATFWFTLAPTLPKVPAGCADSTMTSGA
jgi:signal transduction histidine kinase